MLAETAKIISIVFLTMFKFIFGPTLGFAAGLPLLVTIAITVAGMMLSVILFTFLGKLIKEKIIDRIFKSRKRFSKRTRRFVIIWKKYGIAGIAFLTPIILTPIGGTLILTSHNTPKDKIIFYMLASAIAWAIILTVIVYKLGEEAVEIIR